jgi:hypothetical protein
MHVRPRKVQSFSPGFREYLVALIESCHMREPSFRVGEAEALITSFVSGHGANQNKESFTASRDISPIFRDLGNGDDRLPQRGDDS